MLNFLKNISAPFLKYINRETISYLFFGVLATIVSIWTYVIFSEYFSAVVSNVFSTAIAIVFAFITNKIWVFRSVGTPAGETFKQFVKFVTGRLFTFAAETAVLFVFVDVLAFNGGIFKTLTQIFVIVVNYIISKKAVF